MDPHFVFVKICTILQLMTITIIDDWKSEFSERRKSILGLYEGRDPKYAEQVPLPVLVNKTRLRGGLGAIVVFVKHRFVGRCFFLDLHRSAANAWTVSWPKRVDMQGLSHSPARILVNEKALG